MWYPYLTILKSKDPYYGYLWISTYTPTLCFRMYSSLAPTLLSTLALCCVLPCDLSQPLAPHTAPLHPTLEPHKLPNPWILFWLYSYASELSL